MSDYIDILMPPGGQEGTVSVIESWLKTTGQEIREHEPLIEINTDKVAVEIPSPGTGVLEEILREAGEQVAPGDLLGRIRIGTPRETLESVTTNTIRTDVEHLVGTTSPRDLLSPAVRRMVQKHGLDVSKIQGSGRGGRVTAEDVEKVLAAGKEAGSHSQQTGGSRLLPHSVMRKRIARHMVESALHIAPHVTDVFEADMSAIVRHRMENREEFERRGVRLTYTAYFVEASVRALRAVPEVNSRWLDDALEIFDDCNIGIATALDAGLIVPVIRGAQNLDLFGIAAVLQDHAERARTGSLTAAEVQGGTFTITNHGMTGSLLATPVINQPQSAILGIGKLEKRVVVEEEQGEDVIRIKPMAYITLTMDHRVLDGFRANEFLNTFVTGLQEW